MRKILGELGLDPGEHTGECAATIRRDIDKVIQVAKRGADQRK